MNKKQIEAELRLFNAYSEVDDTNSDLKDVLQYGIYVSTPDKKPSSEVVSQAVNLYGINSTALNNTFHKSYKTVITTDPYTLYLQQILHYITVHFNNIGVSNNIYIPKEELNIPELKEDIKLTNIRYITLDELTKKLTGLVSTSVALSEETLNDIMELFDYIDITDYDQVKNRTLRYMIYDKLNTVPYTGEEFIRYWLFKLTSIPQIVKSRNYISQLKSVESDQALEYVLNWCKCYGDKSLIPTQKKWCDRYYQCLDFTPQESKKYDINMTPFIHEIGKYFLRYKPLILALKHNYPVHISDVVLNNLCNRLDKYADKHKKILDTPQTERLGHIIKLFRTEESIKLKDITLMYLKQDIDKVNVFKLVKIYNYLLEKLYQPDLLNYRIRNGNIYITEKNLNNNLNNLQVDVVNDILNMVFTRIIELLKPKLQNKTVYIPENIDYAVPTSEKQFMGNVPINTILDLSTTDKNLVVSIHWNNFGSYDNVDLDLSATTIDSTYSWNTEHYSSDKNIIFSGDMIYPDKELGATESFLLVSPKKLDNSIVFTMTNYLQLPETFKYNVIISQADCNDIDSKFTLDPNKILFNLTAIKDNNSTTSIIGVFNKNTDGRVTFTLKNDGFTNSRAVSLKDYLMKVYIDHSEQNVPKLMFKYLFSMSGCKIMNKPTFTNSKTGIEKPVDIDLSVNKLNKQTFIDLLK